MNLKGKEQTPWIEVSQWDVYTREIRLLLFEGKKVWNVPEDAKVVIRYQMPNGRRGVYDTLPNGKSAWRARANTLTLTLAPQLLTVPGTVSLYAGIYREEETLNTFEVEVCVRAADQNSEVDFDTDDSFGLTGVLAAPETAKAGQYIRVLDVNALGKVIRVEAVNLPAAGSIDEEMLRQIVEDYFLENPPECDGNNGTRGLSVVCCPEHVLSGQDNQIPLSELRYPAGYAPVVGDLVLCGDGEVCRILEFAEEEGQACTVERTGISLAGPQGDKGDNGYTPIRGTDYWTAADIAQIKSYVDDAILGGVW